MDFPINGEMVHHYCFNRQNVANVFLDIAKRNTAHFSENDLAVAADMVRKGYVVSGENGLLVNAPVFTEEQHQMLKGMFSETAERIAGEAEALMETVIKILKNHIPSHLKRLAKDMGISFACSKTPYPHRYPFCATANSCCHITAKASCLQLMLS